VDDNIKKFKELYFFIDFDGTITKLDIGDDLFKKFGEFEPYHTDLIEGRLKINDYWHSLCRTLKPEVDEETIKQYAMECEVDPYFVSFANYCRSENINISVISDGFDSYISPVLEREKLEWLPVYSNKMIFKKGHNPVPYFPNASESCNCLCASCKRNVVLNATPEDAVIAFVGDGYSDFCVAEHSDIIFAKNALAAYCNEHKLPHYPFSTFFDVLRITKSVLPKKLKIRNQAGLLRKKAYEIE
jgi:2,3-diketo-5-methylthio-1-phosphopentane phosphatase